MYGKVRAEQVNFKRPKFSKNPSDHVSRRRKESKERNGKKLMAFIINLLKLRLYI